MEKIVNEMIQNQWMSVQIGFFNEISEIHNTISNLYVIILKCFFDSLKMLIEESLNVFSMSFDNSHSWAARASQSYVVLHQTYTSSLLILEAY